MIDSGSKQSKRFKEPVNAPGRAVTYTSNTQDKGYKNFNTVGTYSLWLPTQGNNLTVLSYKIAGFNKDPNNNIIGFLEYKVTLDQMVYWEIIDFIILPSNSGVLVTQAILPDPHCITCEEVRLRIVGSSNSFELHTLVEAKEDIING